MDGVVCHNMPAHEQAWRRFFRGYGIKLDIDEFRANTMGMPTREVLRHYFKREIPLAEAAKHAAVKENYYRKLYLPKRRAAAGLRRFLTEARDKGSRVGLGTGSMDDNVSFILDGLRLRASFDAIVDGGMVKKGKPNPETFLALADKLKVRPEDCVVFEDSLLGEEAARRAGMAIVAITTSHRADEFKHARLKARDFNTITLARVAAARGSRAGSVTSIPMLESSR